ncbi:MAG TPA: PAS domain S-box protein [Candidatus Limnocylindrales bacterium]|nr:PAS domain S-box protein [Candidatus Limnocylindrales bacterium]
MSKPAVRQAANRKPAVRNVGRLYAALVESADDAIFSKTLDGTITSWNPGAQRLYGYQPHEIVGQSVAVLAAPDQVPEIRAMLKRLAAGERIEQFETERRHRDGSRLAVSLTLSPIRDHRGSIIGASTIARDISQRVEQQAAISAAEARFQGVIESSPNAWIGVDEEGLVAYANARVGPTFGYPEGEIVGLPIEALVPERFRARHVFLRQAFVAEPGTRAMGEGRDLVGLRRDGSEFPIEISMSGAQDGRLLFASIVDITVRKSLEARLLQAQKLESIGRLAGGIAHDFNNMLFAIRGFAELLEEDLAPDNPAPFDRAAALRSVHSISSVAERASALTGELLAFGRQRVIRPALIAIDAAVVSVEPMIRQLVGTNIDLAIHLDPATGTVQADAGQLGQILVNLVVNARDALPSGGSITIETGNATIDAAHVVADLDLAQGDYVVLSVADTGLGMDAATREHAFEPFFTTKEIGHGTGLGLATTYGIVRQAGGQIWLDSEPGQGTTFRLYFPRVDGPPTEAEVPFEVAPHVATGTILLVEDEPSVRSVTTTILERAGYRVVAVASALVALERLADASTEIDVLVTDAVMPGLSGIELAERAMDREPPVGIVLLSGYLADRLDLDRLLARGAVFAAKPATSKLLLDAVRRALNVRPGVGARSR